jgi:hypothetical protein
MDYPLAEKEEKAYSHYEERIFSKATTSAAHGFFAGVALSLGPRILRSFILKSPISRSRFKII